MGFLFPSSPVEDQEHTPAGGPTYVFQGGAWRLSAEASAATVFRGARVRMTADDNAQNITVADTPVSFDAAQFDTHGFWSAGAPTRLTIPTGLGITYVEVTGQLSLSSTTASTGGHGEIYHYNSANTLLLISGARYIQKSGTVTAYQALTGPTAVSDGDYFVLVAREATDTSVTIEGDNLIGTYMTIHVLSAVEVTAVDEVIGGIVTIASTAPSTPATGDVWIDTT